MKNKILAWFVVGCWMTLIFILSHQPAAVSSGISSQLLEFLLGFIDGLFPGIDARIEGLHTLLRKNAHFFAYFILGILLINALGKWGDMRIKTFYTAFFIALLYAISDEFHQLFIEGRSGELTDILIDSAGAATGLVSSWLVNLLVQKRKKYKINE